MSDQVTDQIGTLIRRLAQTLNRKLSDIVLFLLNHKNAGSIGAVAGFAIAVIFTWKFLKAPPSGQRRSRPKRRVTQSGSGTEGDGAGSTSQDCSSSSISKDLDAIESPVQLNLRQIVRRKLNGGRKMTCQLLGVILEERTPEELQKQATVRHSALEVFFEISKICDIYLMERVLDDESEERVLSALEAAGIFTGGMVKDKVLFCSTEIGRSSFVRQLEPDWHVDMNLDVVSQLSRFVRSQLHISQLDMGKIAPNVFCSESLEQYFSSLC